MEALLTRREAAAHAAALGFPTLTAKALSDLATARRGPAYARVMVNEGGGWCRIHTLYRRDDLERWLREVGPRGRGRPKKTRLALTGEGASASEK